jgi:hypothetical protein
MRRRNAAGLVSGFELVAAGLVASTALADSGQSAGVVPIRTQNLNGIFDY